MAENLEAEGPERRLWIMIDRKGEFLDLTEGNMKVKIQDVVEVISTAPGRAGKRDLMVSYSVDEARFYLLTIPLENVSTAEGTIDVKKVEAEIKKVEAERAKLIGQEFEV